MLNLKYKRNKIKVEVKFKLLQCALLYTIKKLGGVPYKFFLGGGGTLQNFSWGGGVPYKFFFGRGGTLQNFSWGGGYPTKFFLGGGAIP